MVSRLVVRGTHRGEFQGIPPTGRQIEVDAVSICRIVNGKVLEGWIVPDLLGLLQQIGVLPAPEQPAV